MHTIPVSALLFPSLILSPCRQKSEQSSPMSVPGGSKPRDAVALRGEIVTPSQDSDLRFSSSSTFLRAAGIG